MIIFQVTIYHKVQLSEPNGRLLTVLRLVRMFSKQLLTISLRVRLILEEAILQIIQEEDRTHLPCFQVTVVIQGTITPTDEIQIQILVANEKNNIPFKHCKFGWVCNKQKCFFKNRKSSYTYYRSLYERRSSCRYWSTI